MSQLQSLTIKQKLQAAFKNMKASFTTASLYISGFSTIAFIAFISFSHTPAGVYIFGGLDISHDLVHNLVYMCIAIIAIAIGSERTFEMGAIKGSLANHATDLHNLSAHIAQLSAAMTTFTMTLTEVAEEQKKMKEFIDDRFRDSVHTLSRFSKSNKAALEELKAHIHLGCPTIDLEKTILESVVAKMPAELADLFPEEADKHASFFTQAIEEQRVIFDDTSTFSTVYRKWLESHPLDTIYATSSADPAYYWSKLGEENTKIENAIADFIKNGGKMKRIFFVPKNQRDNDDVVGRLDKQVHLGVEVYIMCVEENAQAKLEYFVVDADEPMTFHINTMANRNHTMRDFSCQLSKSHAKIYRNKWNTLFNSNSTYRYLGSKVTI